MLGPGNSVMNKTNRASALWAFLMEEGDLASNAMKNYEIAIMIRLGASRKYLPLTGMRVITTGMVGWGHMVLP